MFIYISKSIFVMMTIYLSLCQVLFCRLTQEQRDVYMEYLQSRECQSILSGKYQVHITIKPVELKHP